MINIKNIFVTTSISIFCGVYSLYNIIYYIQRIEMKHHNQVENLNKMLDDTYKKYENIKYEYLKMKDEIVTLNNKIIVLQDELNNQNNKCRLNPCININTNTNNDYISSDNDSLKISECTDNNDIICDTLCKFNAISPVMPSKESSNSLDTIFSEQLVDSPNFSLQDYSVSLDIESESELIIKKEESYIFNSEESIKRLNEIFNDIGITHNNNNNNNNNNNILDYESELDIVTPPPSKNSSFCSLENGSNQRIRKRSISVSEVNWIDITKKFIFG